MMCYLMMIVSAGDVLYAGRKEGQVEAYLTTGEIKRIASVSSHTHAVYALAASSNRLFTGSDDWSIRLWDTSMLLAQGEIKFVCVVSGHRETVYSLVLHNNFLSSSSWDTSIKV